MYSNDLEILWANTYTTIPVTNPLPKMISSHILFFNYYLNLDCEISQSGLTGKILTVADDGPMRLVDVTNGSILKVFDFTDQTNYRKGQ